jgi:hypothetical protein
MRRPPDSRKAGLAPGLEMDRAELEQLMRDVGQFSEACRISSRRTAA